MNVFRYARGLARLHYGLCPLCNSSPPDALCPICEGEPEYGPMLDTDSRHLWMQRWSDLYHQRRRP